jgi:hypothetical protein
MINVWFYMGFIFSSSGQDGQLELRQPSLEFGASSHSQTST